MLGDLRKSVLLTVRIVAGIAVGMSHAVLITNVERRRRWLPERKLELLMEAFAPGANVAEVARREEISTGLLYRWRQMAMLAREPVAFNAAVLTDPVEAAEAPSILIEFASGARVEVRRSATPELVTADLLLKNWTELS